MYLSRMHIDRFGILHEQDVPGIPPGLSVFLGQNEAGKSTCLNFLQAMLFGYRRGGRSLDPLPTRSAKAISGGSLFLQTEKEGAILLTRRPGARGGELSLARLADGGMPPFAASRNMDGDGPRTGDTGDAVAAEYAESAVLAPSAMAGAALDERDLQNLLTGLTADVFDSIFAFSLKQLMELSALKGDSVRHALHGAAFGTGMQSPVQVLKILEDRMSALVKRDVASASAPVNNNLRELAAVRAELQARGPDLRRYEQLHQSLEELEHTLAERMDRRDRLTISLRKVERRLAVWQQWEEALRLRAELEALGVGVAPSFANAFAPDALQRLESLLVQQEERLFALRGVEGQLERTEREYGLLRPLPVLTAMSFAVQALREQKDQRRHEAQSLSALQGERERLQREQSQTLAALGPGWDIGKTLGLDCSAASLDMVRSASERLEQAGLRLEQAGQNLVRHRAEYAEAATQARNAELALETLEAKYGGSERQLQEAGRSENAPLFPERILRLRHMERLAREHASLAAEMEELLEGPEAVQLQNGAGHSTIWSVLARKGLSVFLASVLVAVCGTGIAAYAAWLADPLMGIEGGVLSLLGLAVLSMTLRAALLGAREQNARFADFQTRLNGYTARRDAVEDAARSLLAALQPWFRPPSSAPDFSMPDEADIAQALRFVEEDGRREQSLRSQLEERLARAGHAEQALAAAEETTRGVELELRQERILWRQWLEERALHPDLSPRGAGEMLQLAREAAKRHGTLEQLGAQQDTVEKKLTDYIASIRRMALEAVEAGELHVVQEPGGKGRDILPEEKNLPLMLQEALHLLDTLGEAVERAGREALLRTQKQEQLEAGTRALKQRQEALDLTRLQVAELLASAGSADAESFRAAFSRWSRIESMGAEERSLLSGMRALAAEEGARMEDVLASLEHTTFDRLEEERLALGSELEVLGGDIRSLTEERGQLRERQSALASDGSGSLLRGREAALCEDLHRYSREWSVLALARQILLDAKARYEKEGREGVLRFASDIFRDITDGEYSGIIASLEGENFLALHHSGEQRDPEKELSQGTREQLYLALRLAYVKNHARSAESLPVILDETLVNFDLRRIRNTARVLAAFAQENQILAFTCHPWLADILLEAGAQAVAPGQAATLGQGSASGQSYLPAPGQPLAAGPAPALFGIARGVISRLPFPEKQQYDA